jgi:hypothetical protein
MYKLILISTLISFSSQAQYLKLSTLTASANSRGSYASQVIGQSSVVAGSTSQARQGFKQAFQSSSGRTNSRIITIISEGGTVNWSYQTFPNPFVDVFTVKLIKPAKLSTRLMLYDMDANLIWEGVYDENCTEMSLGHLKDIRAGKYILNVFHHGKPQTMTLIKSIQ